MHPASGFTLAGWPAANTAACVRNRACLRAQDCSGIFSCICTGSRLGQKAKETPATALSVRLGGHSVGFSGRGSAGVVRASASFSVELGAELRHGPAALRQEDRRGLEQGGGLEGSSQNPDSVKWCSGILLPVCDSVSATSLTSCVTLGNFRNSHL